MQKAREARYQTLDFSLQLPNLTVIILLRKLIMTQSFQDFVMITEGTEYTLVSPTMTAVTGADVAETDW